MESLTPGKVIDKLSFPLSRIYAQGWNAARRLSLSADSGLNKPATNPYQTDPERARWNEGFAKGST